MDNVIPFPIKKIVRKMPSMQQAESEAKKKKAKIISKLR